MAEENDQRQHSPQHLTSEEKLGAHASGESAKHLSEVVHESVSFARAIISLPPHPFQGGINAEHLTKLIEHEEHNEQRAFEDVERLRKHTTWRLVIFSLLFVFVVAFIGFTNPSMLIQVLEGLALFAGGVGGGLGLKSYLDRKKR
jgi:hypothetical protein